MTRTSLLTLAAVFAMGLTILIAAIAYSGHVLPSQPSASASGYDWGGYIVELVIWLVTATVGVILIYELCARSPRRD